MLAWFTGMVVFIFGACIGSFMNVCIYRLPRSMSVLNPRRSVCPHCSHPIKFYDNIPVVSYAILKGQCRNCHKPISMRYPTVEMISGIFALFTVLKFGLTPIALVYFIFIASLIVITYIDMDYQIIPDVITLPGIPLFFLGSLIIPSVALKDAVLGLLIGGGSLFLIAWGYHLMTKKEGMGGGDIKLLAMIGALIGWKGVLFTIFFSSAVGTISGLLLMFREKKGMKLAIPFGPFLSLGAIAYIFFGPQIIGWYVNLLRY
jgi:leader peptidase (prepilin peptidase)/N-methyltransferase